ncbi:MAG: NusG domain II-containing protein [Synergistaceae bacterium]
MRTGDKILFLIFFLFMILFAILQTFHLYYSTENRVAYISQNGKIIKRINMENFGIQEKRTMTINGPYGTNIITMKKGQIAVTYADCPDKDCIRRGWLSHNGDSAVCLPNRLSIKVKGRAEISQVDGTTY